MTTSSAGHAPRQLNIDDTISFLIHRIHVRGVIQMRRALQKTGTDITPEQLGLMARLRQCPGMNQSQLGEKTFKDRPNTTRILRLLEVKGLIERRPDLRNSRANLLFLTERGNDVFDRLVPVVVETWRTRVMGLAAVEIEAVRALLQRIAANIEEALGEP